MKALVALLIVLFAMATCHSQSLEAEDRYLRQQYEAGTISLDRYRKLAGNLRGAAARVGGYPEIPVDSLGRYDYTTRISIPAPASRLWEIVNQWLALTGYVAVENLQYTDPKAGRLIVKLAGPFQFTEQGRQSMPYHPEWTWGSATVECVLDLKIAEGTVTGHWLQPALGRESRRWPTEELLPVIRFRDHRYFTWEDRLHRSRLIHTFVEGLAADLEAYLTTALP